MNRNSKPSTMLQCITRQNKTRQDKTRYITRYKTRYKCRVNNNEIKGSHRNKIKFRATTLALPGLKLDLKLQNPYWSGARCCRCGYHRGAVAAGGGT